MSNPLPSRIQTKPPDNSMMKTNPVSTTPSRKPPNITVKTFLSHTEMLVTQASEELLAKEKIRAPEGQG